MRLSLIENLARFRVNLSREFICGRRSLQRCVVLVDILAALKDDGSHFNENCQFTPKCKLD